MGNSLQIGGKKGTSYKISITLRPKITVRIEENLQ